MVMTSQSLAEADLLVELMLRGGWDFVAIARSDKKLLLFDHVKDLRARSYASCSKSFPSKKVTTRLMQCS